MWLRKYRSSDCKYLAKLFYQMVHCINARDYTEEQLNAWATGKVELQEWDKSFREHKTIVAVEETEIVGFGDGVCFLVWLSDLHAKYFSPSSFCRYTFL